MTDPFTVIRALFAALAVLFAALAVAFSTGAPSQAEESNDVLNSPRTEQVPAPDTDCLEARFVSAVTGGSVGGEGGDADVPANGAESPTGEMQTPAVNCLPVTVPDAEPSEAPEPTRTATPTTQPSGPSAAPTAVPPTAVPPTAVPPTAVPPTAVPPTAVPPTAEEDAASQDSADRKARCELAIAEGNAKEWDPLAVLPQHAGPGRCVPNTDPPVVADAIAPAPPAPDTLEQTNVRLVLATKYLEVAKDYCSYRLAGRSQSVDGGPVEFVNHDFATACRHKGGTRNYLPSSANTLPDGTVNETGGEPGVPVTTWEDSDVVSQVNDLAGRADLIGLENLSHHMAGIGKDPSVVVSGPGGSWRQPGSQDERRVWRTGIGSSNCAVLGEHLRRAGYHRGEPIGAAQQIVRGRAR